MTLTSEINGQLGLICVLCVVLVLGVLLYRICHIICSTLLMGILFLPSASMSAADMAEAPLRKYAQRGLIGSALRFVTLIVLTVLQLVVVALNVALTIVYGLLPLVGLALLFVLMHEKWSESMLVLVDLLNGQVGSTLHQLIIAPLTLLDVVGSHVLPVYNLVVYVVLQMPLQLLMWLLKGQGFYHLLDALHAARTAAGFLVGSTKTFVVSNAQICSSDYQQQQRTAMCSNMSSAACGLQLDAGQVADMCLNAASRELDFLPAFDRLQQTTGHALLFVGDSCSFLGVLANVTLFPLSDPETWVALDRLLNAVLYATVAAPSGAISRCSLAGGIEARPAMCTPDFGPAFDKLADFGVHLGNVLTNWMDAAYLFLFQQTNLQSVCASTSSLNSILWSDPVVQRMFGSNKTVLVHMGTGAFAVTDGNGVVFMKRIGGQIATMHFNRRQSFQIIRDVLPSNYFRFV